MKLHYYTLALLIFGNLNLICAQDNLSVSFSSLPSFLNVCGDSDQETISVSLNGTSTETRSNIQATANLFKGIEFISLDPGSSPGVVLIDGSDPNRPIFGIPDLSPSGVSSVDLILEVRARCGYMDTLQSSGGVFTVQDSWDFNYDLGTLTDQSESDLTEEYRDELAFPIFNLQVSNTFGPARLNDCFSREISVLNSGINGFVDTVIYENVQGAGVYVSDILVNGSPVSFSKSLNMSGDTVITFGLGGANFATIAGGDGDGFFDPSETVVIEEQICLLDCLGERSSSHSISWGCDDRYCETSTIPDFVAVGQGAADISVTQTGTIPDQNVGYCQEGNLTLTFTNNGIEIDPGFATMLDVSTGISLAYVGDAGILADAGVTITEVHIAGVNVTTPSYLIDLNNNPQFQTTDPDGAGGLSDFDSDGYFDDLEINESIEVTVYFEFDCGTLNSSADDCENNYTTNFSGIMQFTDLCGVRSERPELNFASITQKDTEEFFNADPDAYMVVDTFYLDYELNRKITGFDMSCGTDEEMIIAVKLPSGINLLESATSYILDGVDPLAIKSNLVSNDTLYLTFDATTVSNAAANGETIKNAIKLAFIADCSANVGPTVFPFELAHYCPSCDCKHVWHCEEFVGPHIHTSNPPCPPLACPIGVQATSFNVERTTFGFQDEFYTIPFDENLANKKAGLACDSVEISITNIVGDTPLTDSIGMVITYNNPDGSTSTDETFLFAIGNLEIVQGATITNCKVFLTSLSVSSVDSTKTLRFDLSSCITDLGLTLQPGDQLNFTGKFTINPEGPYVQSEFEEVANFRGYGFATVDGVDYACDNYGDQFTVGSLYTATAYPNSSTSITGCQEVTLNVQIITQLIGYTEVMGFEHRPVIKVDSLVIDYDPSILTSFDKFEASLMMPGHPDYGDNAIPMPDINDFTPGRYVVYLDTLDWGPSILNSAATYPFNFSIAAIPNCQTNFGNASMGATYQFNPGLSFYEYAYALEYGDGSCSNYIEELATNSTLEYSKPPDMNFVPVTAPNYNLFQDTAEWVVLYCNTTDDADIGFSWLALEDSIGSIEIVSVEDISLPDSPVNLPFETYGTQGNNYLIYTDGLKRDNGSNGIEEVCNRIRFRAVVNDCGILNFEAKTGWNCLAPSDPDWTPEDYDPCQDLEMELSIINQEPFLDAQIEQEPVTTAELCEENEIVIRVKNTLQGYIYDLRSDFILPPNGVSFVPGSFELAYPATAAFAPIATDPVMVGSNAQGTIYRYVDFSAISAFLDKNGLQGTLATMPSDSTELLIKFKIATDCDFVSGQRVFYEFVGEKACGGLSNTESGETLPISVVGLPDPNDNGFDVAFGNGTELVPNEMSTISIEVTNTNPIATDDSDFIRIRLPNDVIYQMGSAVAVQPSSWIPGEPVVDVGATHTDYTWGLPIGLAQGELAILEFDVMSPDYDCSMGALSIDLNTVVRTVVTCMSTATDCEIEAFTSSNNGTTTELSILHESLVFKGVIYTSECLDGDSETVTVSGGLINLDTPIGATSITVNYYFDNDGSGIYDGTEPIVSSNTVSGPIASMETSIFDHSFVVDLDQICAIIAVIDTTGLTICGGDQLLLGEPQLINAGVDQQFCETSATTITTELGDAACAGLTGYSYSWNAIAPAVVTDLSATDIANPILTVAHDALVEDTLSYVLTTERMACGGVLVTMDTIQIIRSLGIVLSNDGPFFAEAGLPIALSVTASNGIMPYTYSWSPTTGLDDPTSATPTATVTENTTYTVIVTSGSGCSEMMEVEVLLSSGCDHFFGQLAVDTTLADCSDIFEFCVDIPFDDLADYTVAVNDELYSGNFVECNFEIIFRYNYLNVSLNIPGPYTLMNWTVNGMSYTSDFATMDELVDSMNVWDPAGNWENIPGAATISGGTELNEYGDLTIESQTGIPSDPIMAQETIDPSSWAIELNTGIHEVVVTNNISNCADTIDVNVACPPYRYQTVTICLGDTASFSIDTSLLNLSSLVDTSSNICATNGFALFNYIPSTFTIEYAGFALGMDTACIEFITIDGERDTLQLAVTVEECVSCYSDTVYINQTKYVTVNQANLAGPITSMENTCSDPLDTMIIYEYDLIIGAVEYSGLNLGFSDACIKYCDDFGNCDSISLCLETIPYFDPPIANDDVDTTSPGIPILIDFKANDILFGGVDTAYIISGPNYGTLGTPGNPGALNLDCTVTYNPDDEICEREDQFVYVVCTPNGCDTATVFIWLECPDIVIFTAVSPNGDGVNDFFHIAGIDEYPNSELEIFNRWGNLVYNVKGYNNSWNGSWNNKSEVPDGSYYYVLKLNDRRKRVFNGYFELYR